MLELLCRIPGWLSSLVSHSEIVEYSSTRVKDSVGRECKVAWIPLQMTYPLFFSFSCDEFACYFSRYARGMDCVGLLGFGGI